MEIAGKVALITGGASGMGAATALHLSQLGAKIAILDSKEPSASQSAHSEVGFGQVCDVSDHQAVREAVEAAANYYGALHIVVHCAGVLSAARIVGRTSLFPIETFRRVIEVNLVGTFNVLQAAAVVMQQQDPVNTLGERGVVINTASIAAFEGQIGQAAYSASKGGVVAMTLPAARELGVVGIRVMTIAPGLIETPMLSELSEESQQQLFQLIPFPKRLGQPTEFAQLVVAIIENPYLNGSVIRLDGALRMSA